jgi:hypothetical protein
MFQSCLDQITLKKLVLIKQLYQRAEIQSFSESNVDRIMAVTTFDLAIETALKAVIRSLDHSKTPSDGFESFLQQAESLLSKKSAGAVKEIPDRAHVKSVHSIRNDIQHEAQVPDKSVVSDCRTYTRDFFQKLILDVWGLSFDKISLTDLIHDEKVKKFLVDAEVALDQEDRKKAVEYAAAGLSWALICVRTAVVGRNQSFARAFVIEESPGHQKASKEIYRAFQRMQETLLFIALGMNYNEYMRYRKIAGNIAFNSGGGYSHFGMKTPLDANDGEFVVAYCIETVIQIESRTGSLDKPFGSDRYEIL